MSKSDASAWACIMLTDSEHTIQKKCRKALSDTNPTIEYDPVNRLAISNLILLYSSFTGKEPYEIVEKCNGMNTLEFKDILAGIINTHIYPIREKYFKIRDDPKNLQEIIDHGNIRARKIAVRNLEEIKEIVGLNSRNL